jgi:hypothetical protein
MFDDSWSMKITSVQTSHGAMLSPADTPRRRSEWATELRQPACASALCVRAGCESSHGFSARLARARQAAAAPRSTHLAMSAGMGQPHR